MSVAVFNPLEQRHEALCRGNGVRSQRKAIKAELSALPERDAKRRVAEMLAGGLPRALEQMYIFEVLMLAPRMGDVTVRRVLSRAGVYPLKRAVELTQRQRLVLADALRGMAGSSR